MARTWRIGIRTALPIAVALVFTMLALSLIRGASASAAGPTGLIVSEVAPWSSGNSLFMADWFEVTNTGAGAVNITGWKMDDNSNGVTTGDLTHTVCLSTCVPLNGITSIAPSESVIFIEVVSPATPASVIAGFKHTWFGANPPATLQIGTYSGSGVGLSTGGDSVNLFDTTNALQVRVNFGAATTSAPFRTFDNAAGQNNSTTADLTAISTLSSAGTHGAFAAACDAPEIGSPGSISGAGLVLPACGIVPPLKINEVQPKGAAGTSGDWVELVNGGASPLDISGFAVLDNDDAHTKYQVPAGTPLLAPAGLFVLTGTQFQFDLGSVDSVRVFATDGMTLADSYSWAADPVTSYGRCPSVTGPIMTTMAPTEGAANKCLADVVSPEPWPGSALVAPADAGGSVFGQNLSGLVYEASNTAAPGALWAVDNGPSAMYRLVWNGSIWIRDTANGWGAGKSLRYPSGLGDPDAEGVTFTDEGPAGGIYVSTERDNNNSGVSKLDILRFDISGAATTLNATREWDLTSDLPSLALVPGGANLGLEAITWIPDGFLTGKGFFDEMKGHPFAPGDYPLHGHGLFFVGVEASGLVYGYALNSDGTFNHVATIVTGFGTIMDLSFDAARGNLWAVCDNSCNGRTELLTIGGDGRFGIAHLYERPAGMPNINNEGFATASELECVGGLKPAFWSDDDNDGGIALRRGTVPCSQAQALDIAISGALGNGQESDAFRAQAGQILTAPDANAKAGMLRAFTNHVNAQRGKALTPVQADLLIALAKLL